MLPSSPLYSSWRTNPIIANFEQVIVGWEKEWNWLLISMDKISGQMWPMMKLKLTKEQRFTLSRESAFLETPQANQTDPSSIKAF